MPDHTAIPVPEARQRGLQARRCLSTTQRRERSEAIVQRLLDMPELAGGGNAGWYLALSDEVDLSAGVAEMRARGWHLHLPRLANGARMSFVEWLADAPLTANRFGIGEAGGPAVGVCELQVVVVPCVALDASGARVGFGAGYYDQALGDAGCPPGRPIRVGVAFGVQLVDRIETRPWDQAMDVVVTDTGTHRPPARPEPR